jgi:hypothetical protein
MTLWSLAGQTLQFVRALVAAQPGAAVIPQVANAAVAVLLFGLTAFLVVEAIRVLSRPRPAGPVAGVTAS